MIVDYSLEARVVMNAPTTLRPCLRRCWLVFILFLTAAVVEVDLERTRVKTGPDAVNYLAKYGHISSKDLSTFERQNKLGGDMSLVRPYILNFQRFAGLDQTGILDVATQSKMSLNRCGNLDVSQQQKNDNKRSKRFALGGNPWQTNTLQYYFYNTSSKLDQGLVKNIVNKATQFWSNVSGLVFSETTSFTSANIKLLYARLNHGDGYPFDGPGGILAHTFFPNNGAYSGESHFDDDETWTDGEDRGTNLLQATIHELGHALGLAHSPDVNSIMQPFYTGYNPNVKLGQDDINGIIYLYGKFSQTSTTSATTSTTTTTTTSTSSTTTTTTTTTTPTTTTTTTTVSVTSPSVSAICANATIDAIESVNNAIYVFIGNQYLIMDCCNTPLGSIRQGFPRPLSEDWPGLAISSVDAAIYLYSTSTSSMTTGYLYLFSGQLYFRYSNLPSLTIDTGYPRKISAGFPGVPDNIDAAFVWGVTNQIYFIKGSLYYRYVPKLGVDKRFPKPLTLWSGLPSKQRVDAAFRSPDMTTYFFSGTSFYQFDETTSRVGAPLSTARHWFDCTSG